MSRGAEKKKMGEPDLERNNRGTKKKKKNLSRRSVF